ncbi:hypothetical protein GE09DRAFT_1154924 [Coniochaeta sp. 2T2.1]|nr:hypothetical protein GE09DRAFT_1154924 [Coniochaeta sp. 2T2.1]
MQLKTTLALVAALAAQVAMCWSIPKGTAPGVYSVEVFDNGTEHHVFLSHLPNVTTTPRSGPRHISARFLPSRDTAGAPKDCKSRDDEPCPRHTECYLREGPAFISPDETDSANAGIDAQCGDGATVGHGKDLYSVDTCSVAYVCNMGGSRDWDGTCTAAERRKTSEMITKKCGAYIPGSSTQTRWMPPALDSKVEGTSRTYQMMYGYEAYCTSFGHDFCGRGADGHNG